MPLKDKQIKPPITYFGNKAGLAKWICAQFPVHQTYVEPFGGSASVLLAKRPSKVEVYNDLNRELVTLFEVLRSKEDFKQLRDMLEFTPYSRAEFKAAKEILPADDKIEIARKALVKFRQSYGGLEENWSHCKDESIVGMSASVRKWLAGVERLPEIHKRMRRVQIECLDWQAIFKKYDAAGTLFYIDPPYVADTRIEGAYKHELTDADHKKLVTCLLQLKGKAILSGYAHQLYRPLEEAGWKRLEKAVAAATSAQRTKRIECLWLSPTIDRQKRKGLLKQQVNQQDLFATPKEMMRLGAYHTHRLRTARTEQLVMAEIDRFKRMGWAVNKLKIAESLNLRREHLSRKYAHLFKV